jgi:hypothetical protein
LTVSAKVVADSQYRDARLITLEIELHRFILPEANTHKALSRNYQSSRAIPILRQLEQIANDPAMPVYYGKDQAGMVAGEELEGRDLELAKMIILGMRDACLNGVKQLHKLNLHKQVSNRYVEPWMWTKGVITATHKDFKAMFKLRRHFAAQPEIKALFDVIYEAIEGSTPETLKPGQWHLPYVHTYFEGGKQHFTSQSDEKEVSLVTAIKISSSCVAQVSYRKLNDSLEKALTVYDMLNLPVEGVYPDDPPHFSPTEHIAKAGDCEIEMSGNFHTDDFIQYRKVLEKGLEKKYIGG